MSTVTHYIQIHLTYWCACERACVRMCGEGWVGCGDAHAYVPKYICVYVHTYVNIYSYSITML